MKRQLKGFMLGVIFTTFLMTGFSTFASSLAKKIDALVNTLTVKVNSQIIRNDNIVYNGNAYVRADAIAAAFNKDFAWDKSKNVISISDKTVGKSVSTKSSSSSPKVSVKDPISFSNILFVDEMGSTIIYGEAKNNDSKQHSFTLKVSFYDKNGKLLGTAAGTVNNVNGGDTKLFTAMGMDDYSNADSYKVQVDTMLDSTSNQKVPIDFSNFVMKSDSGMTTIEGETTNNDTKAHSFTLNVGIYDNTGKLLGVASGVVNDLQPGDTKTFDTISTNDYPDDVKLKVLIDTLIQ